MFENSPEFFASMNTTKGFQSYFSAIFDPNQFNSIYILKGGPGTGKSSLMKSIARRCEEKGLEIEKYLCSADSNSLDGVIIKDKKVAIIDGTAPHTTDPSFPGVVENIINLGSYWDTKKLLPHKRKILELIREKKRHFQRAYQFLKADEEIASDVFSFSTRFINGVKMMQNIKVQCAYFFQKQTVGSTEIKNIESFSKLGKTRLDSFEKMSSKIWVIEDHCFTAYKYLSSLQEYAKSKEQDVVISYSPIFTDSPNAIYFPKSNICFTIGKRAYEKELSNKEYHYINMKRFINTSDLSQGKQKIKFAEKCIAALEEGASVSLLESAKCHAELENYYVSAMNFEKIETLKKEILTSIFDKNYEQFS